MMSHSTISRRVTLAIGALIAIGTLRFAFPAWSASITSSAVDKLTVYSGVVMVIADPASALELGNKGQDITSTREVFFRPGLTTEGTYFATESPVCAVSGTACGSINDCSNITDPNTGKKQACLNNLHDLTLTGDLIINGQLCFEKPALDCAAAWPGDLSANWAAIGSNHVLTPLQHSDGTHDQIRIGDSAGHCTVTGNACFRDADCPASTPAQTCNLFAYSGLASGSALMIYANTTSPALHVTGFAIFGDPGYYEKYYQKSGNVQVDGNVYVDYVVTKKDWFGGTWNVWNMATNSDTQDGSGIDADTLNGEVRLPLSYQSELNDLRWLQTFQSSTASPGVAVGNNLTLVPLMCVHIKSSTGSVCLSGANAGKSCSSNTDCIANETCTGAGYCSVNTSISCTNDSQCPGKTAHPASGNNATCQKLCPTSQGQCAVDNVKRCHNSTATICSTDADCGSNGPCEDNSTAFHCTNFVNGVQPACTVDSDCDQSGGGGNYCIPGRVYSMPSACSDSSCATYCRAISKCTGANPSMLACASQGQNVNYNSGTCVTKNAQNFCRCSLNVQNLSSIPYIDITQGGQSTAGDACSAPFGITNATRPAPTS